jgi:hypothetical protein
MVGQEKEHRHSPHAHKEAKEQPPAQPKEELHDVERSLFSDARDDDRIGLVHRPKDDAPMRKEAGESGEKRIVLSFNPGKIKAWLKKAAFWAVFAALVVSFFFNPFYCYFPWNYPLCTGESLVEDADEAAVEETETADEAKAPAEELETVDEEPEAEPLPAAEEEGPPAAEEAAEEEMAVAAGTVTLNITSVELIKTTYGWKVGKVGFTAANGKDEFVAKVRARGFNSHMRFDERSDKALIIGALAEGKSISGDIQLDAQFDKPGQKLVVLELFDEGGEPGSARDRRMASAEKVVTAS